MRPERSVRTKKTDPRRIARVLVMDDDAMVRELVSKMLVRISCQVEVADDGEQALQMYKQSMDVGRPFYCVIMDLTIPGGLGGQETIRHMQAMDPGVTAIVSSGYADTPIMANFADYGFKGAIAKPYTMVNLHATVEQCLAVG